jgi:hypothetical protein
LCRKPECFIADFMRHGCLHTKAQK